MAILNHSIQWNGFFSTLFSRQRTEDFSSLPVPRPRVKKRLSASFPDDAAVLTDEVTHPEECSNKNINEPVLTKRKTKTEAAAAASEAEVYE